MSIPLSPILALVTQGVYKHWCPACHEHHLIFAGKRNGLGLEWRFNLDPIVPTFEPSVVITYGDGRKCHYTITDGRILFHNDCSHYLRGQTQQMPTLAA